MSHITPSMDAREFAEWLAHRERLGDKPATEADRAAILRIQTALANGATVRVRPA